ncbi:MAG: bifunctional hydroxymethylpyrimidine kinase/phosphomethylpyrimidine kinase [Acidobacteriia bacterium]|nr:bifunctional hydroxymethylpyrimidine kinase/phosphomethylpyrimidine kinase [Methyloceanibacter sp.]MCL6490890.1 bifunctional hydroxymethylpyrimidine kinase/phosphomethylpyrimidine kinase [Terriglobia bacterium]
MRGRVLVIGGSDSSGGAGIQADVKTLTALGAYAATAITALTAQNSQGVQATIPVPPSFIGLQIALALAEPGSDAVKTGMLVNAATVAAVCDALQAASAPPRYVVVDPVLRASSGGVLLNEEGLRALKQRLLPMAYLITPNVPEAEQLSGMHVGSIASMQRAAEALLGLGVPAVLVKGGHLPGPIVVDVLATARGTECFQTPRLTKPRTHGTGCTLASAIAAGLAQGLDLSAAVARARRYVQDAITHAPDFGAEAGLLNHAVWKEEKEAGPLSPTKAARE